MVTAVTRMRILGTHPFSELLKKKLPSQIIEVPDNRGPDNRGSTAQRNGYDRCSYCLGAQIRNRKQRDVYLKSSNYAAAIKNSTAQHNTLSYNQGLIKEERDATPLSVHVASRVQTWAEECVHLHKVLKIEIYIFSISCTVMHIRLPVTL